jgi:purine nucleoside phosphorylase
MAPVARRGMRTSGALLRSLAVRIGVITGSGSHALPSLEDATTRTCETRFGAVALSEGLLAGTPTVHISRHGDGHERLSSHVNHRANIEALAASAVDGILAVTVCGAVDATLALGAMVVFDDLHFISNRLPDGSLCTLHDEPGRRGRGHWDFEVPFSAELRDALLQGSREAAHEARDGGCYGHVDGPRFNSRTEIASLRAAGVSAVSQTAGPETVLAGEAELPYALTGYVTDYANGVTPEPTPVAELVRLVEASRAAFDATLRAAAAVLATAASAPRPTGSMLRFD